MKFSIDKSYKPDKFVEKRGHHIWADLTPEEQEDEVNKLYSYKDRYTDRELIGEGAIKAVYRCYDTQLKRYVALAQTKEGISKDFDHQLIYEAWLTADLQHPNIIGVHNIGKNIQGRPYFIMDLLSNHTLFDYVQESNSEFQLLQVFLKVCEAIRYAHSIGILHLDLKPENIQVGDFGEILVCDWGLGKKDADLNHEDRSLTGDVSNTVYGEIKGSLGFMAPEQAIVDGEKDHRTDIYGLGCLLYFLVTKEAVHSGKKEEVLQLLQNAEYVSPRERFPKLRLAKTLDQILKKCLEPNPGDRYQSVKTLHSDIQNYLT